MSEAKPDCLILKTFSDLSYFDISKVLLDDYQVYYASSFELNYPQPSDIAYIIYTSGTTGVPKGIAVTHANLGSLLSAQRNILKINGPQKWLLFANTAFDASIWEIWGALIHGIELVIPTDKKDLISEIESHQISIVTLPPSVLETLPKVELPSLKTLIIAGEKAPTHLSQVWGRNRRFLNAYGPTETTICATYAEFSTKEKIQHIGKPIENSTVYVLDLYQQLLPIGCEGEIYISGAGVSNGYFKNPTLTANCFVLNPYSEQFKIMYKTGDLGKWRKDGNIDYTGRKDHQSKRMGNRFDLSEVTEAILHLPEVKEVEIFPPSSEGKKCNAFILLKDKVAGIDATTLRAKLKNKLPSYMLPEINLLSQWPLTSQGKVDRKSLQEKLIKKESALRKTPSTSPTHLLQTLFSEALNAEVSIHQNFFELGGDSIIPMQIAGRAHTLGYPFKPSDLFKYPTIHQLVSKIGETTFEAKKKISNFYLTPIQAWFFETISPDTSHFHQAYLGYLDHTVNLPLLIKAFELYFHQNPIFSIRYHKKKRWYPVSQKNLKNIEIEIEENTITEKVTFQFFTHKPLYQEIDIQQKHIAYVNFFKTLNKRGCFIAIHHLYVDGISWGILLGKIHEYYACLQNQRPIYFEDHEKDLFREWLHALRQYSVSKERLTELPFWQGQIVPGKKPYLLQKSRKKSTYPFTFSAECSQKVTGISLSHPSLSTRDILLASFLLTYKTWSGYDYFSISLEGHGREDLPESRFFSSLMGWFTSLFPLAFNLAHFSSESFLEALLSVKAKFQQLPNNGIGYGILKYLKKIKSLQSTAEPEISFNYLGILDNRLSITNWIQADFQPLSLLSSEKNPAPHLIDTLLWVNQGQIHGELGYSVSHFSEEKIKELSLLYSETVYNLIKYLENFEIPFQLISDLPSQILSPHALNIFKETCLNCESISTLLPIQKGFLYHWLANPKENIYQVQATWLFSGEVEIPILKAAWEKVLLCYPSLRSTFLWEGLHEPIQIVHASPTLKFEYSDFSALKGREITKQLEKILAQDRHNHFDLQKSPCIRFYVLKQNSQTYFGLLSCHHIMADAWSLNSIFHALLRFYQALKKGETFEQKIIKNEDYLKWFKIQSQEKGQKFWQKNLLGVGPAHSLNLEKNGIKMEISTERYPEKKIILKKNLHTRLLQLSRKEKVTLSSLIQTLWIHIVGWYSQKEDIVIGVTLSLRPENLAQVEEMVGPFINTLPLRIKLSRIFHEKVVKVLDIL